MVAIAALSQGTALAMTLSVYSLAKPYVRAEFELTDLQASLALTLVIIYTTLLAPFLGSLADAGNVHRLMAGGAVLMGFGMASVRSIFEPVPLLIVYVLMIGTAEGMMGVVPSGALISKWFAKRIALALGTAMLGVTILQSSATLLDHAMELIGWRDVAGILGFFAVVVLLPAAWFGVVERPSDVGQLPDGEHSDSGPTEGRVLGLRTILTTPEFWLVSQGSVLVVALLVMFNMHSGQHVRDLSLATGTAGIVLTTLAAGSMVGISAGGILGDRFPLKWIYTLAIGLQALAWLWLAQATGPEAIVLGALLLSSASGLIVPLRGRAIREIFGEASFGRVLGLMLFCSLPVLLTVILGSAGLHDRSGSYFPAFRLALTGNALSLLLIWLARFSHRVVEAD